MSRHNYSQYSNNKNKHNERTTEAVEEQNVVIPECNVEPEITVTPAVVAETQVAPDTKPKAEVETVTGTVANCAKLNVRAKPNATADVVCVLDAASEIAINVKDSNREWFKVCTATGVEGYCMRKFVTANL